MSPFTLLLLWVLGSVISSSLSSKVARPAVVVKGAHPSCVCSPSVVVKRASRPSCVCSPSVVVKEAFTPRLVFAHRQWSSKKHSRPILCIARPRGRQKSFTPVLCLEIQTSPSIVESSRPVNFRTPFGSY
eukprot:scaffold7180_cov50-Cyclotella_meneghiniana.AAC.1